MGDSKRQTMKRRAFLKTLPAITALAGADRALGQNAPPEALPKSEQSAGPALHEKSALRLKAKDTLTALEMNRGEAVEFELRSGDLVRIELVATSARILRTTLKELKVEEHRGRTDYAFDCVLQVNGREHRLEREVSTQRSFYEPWEFDGVRLW